MEEDSGHAHRIAMLDRAMRLNKIAKALKLVGLVTVMCAVPLSGSTGGGGLGASGAFRVFAANAPWTVRVVVAAGALILISAVGFRWRAKVIASHFQD